MTTEGDRLWSPSDERARRSRLQRFSELVDARHDLGLPEEPQARYAALHEWSVRDLDGFWRAVWEHVEIPDGPAGAVLADTADGAMPGARWFPGTRLNYASVALARRGPQPAVVACREDGREVTLSRDDLRAAVGAAAAGLRRLGVQQGDRVAAVVPNSEHAVIAFLATVSLGAVWTSCAPEFGARGLIDRFSQVEPTVLIGVDGYLYGGKRIITVDRLAELQAALPSLRATVVIPWLDADDSGTPDGLADPGGVVDPVPWSALLAEAADPDPVAVEAEAPLWILYSSGTTGLPKPIVHGHAGVVLEHAKQLALHCDVREGDTFFWFSTCGWMMWNLLVSASLVGATVVAFDGNPAHPDMAALWRMAERVGVTHFGTSAPFIHASMNQGVRPSDEADLTSLRVLGSTGAPLSPEGFAYLYDHVGDVLVASLSGGTDLVSAFVVSVPTLPVHAGELQGPSLGCAVAVLDPAGNPVDDEVGELCMTRPMPSMPLQLWGDHDGSRLRETYYTEYPGLWRHGDWAKRVSERGSYVIYGRSDSTLNRGGVRIGTAEFYRVVEDLDGVADSLVVDTGGLGQGDGRLLLYVVPAQGRELDETLVGEIRATLRTNLSPRHVPDEITAIRGVPTTLNGKKLEVPVKKLLAGVPIDQAVARSAVADLSLLDPFVEAGRSD